MKRGEEKERGNEGGREGRKRVGEKERERRRVRSLQLLWQLHPSQYYSPDRVFRPPHIRSIPPIILPGAPCIISTLRKALLCPLVSRAPSLKCRLQNVCTKIPTSLSKKNLFAQNLEDCSDAHMAISCIFFCLYFTCAIKGKCIYRTNR